MFHRNLGWAGSGLLLFFAAIWLAAAAVVAATNGAELWMVGWRGSDPCRGPSGAAHQGRLHGRQMPVVARRFRGRGGRLRNRLPDPGTGAREWLVAAARFARACPAAGRFGFLVDFGADPRRAQDARPYRRVQAISVDHRARAARPDDSACRHAASCSRNICPSRSRSGSRTAGPSASQASSQRLPRRVSRGSPGIRAAATRGAIRPASPTAWARRWQHHQLGLDRAGIEQRLGRRRIVGRRRRRWWRRRLVIRSGPAA